MNLLFVEYTSGSWYNFILLIRLFCIVIMYRLIGTVWLLADTGTWLFNNTEICWELLKSVVVDYGYDC